MAGPQKQPENLLSSAQGKRPRSSLPHSFSSWLLPHLACSSFPSLWFSEASQKTLYIFQAFKLPLLRELAQITYSLINGIRNFTNSLVSCISSEIFYFIFYIFNYQRLALALCQILCFLFIFSILSFASLNMHRFPISLRIQFQGFFILLSHDTLFPHTFGDF